METIAEQAEEIYRERILRARRMNPAQKFWDGATLYDFGRRIAFEGAAGQAGEAGAATELARRMAIRDVLAAQESA